MADQDLIQMFFDDEFVPHAYLDALFSMSGANSSTIQTLQQRSQLLLGHLDYYTRELTNDLEKQISKLHASNSIVSYSYNDEKALEPTTRLEYYVDSLSISVQSLNDTVQGISTKMAELKSGGDSETTGKVLQLTKARANLLKVQHSLETIKSVVDIAQVDQPTTKRNTRLAPTSTKSTDTSIVILPSQLSSAIDILKQTIVEQIQERKRTETSEQIDKELMSKIDELSGLLPVFKSLGEFYTIYSNFVKFIQAEKEGYLTTKTTDEELQILS